MASHYHHPHSHHHQNHPPTATTCCCTTSFSSCHCTQSHPSYPPPHPHQPPPDPLLQALASQLLISNPPDPYLHHHQNPHKTHKPHHPKHPSHIPQHQLHSLLSRIEALEASLHSHSHSHSSNSYSLRDYAACVIQTHFRAFLVRRSRTLRQLKDLAFIKSSFASLKSSVSNQTHFDFHSVSQKALALLIKLDSIQCGDPIVRDGRRSISRDIVRFLDFIEGVVVKRQGVCLKLVKNVRSNVRNVQNVGKSRGLGGKCAGLGKDQREMIGKLKERIEKIRGFARVSENEEEDVELEGFQHVSDDDEESGGQYENGAAVKFQPKVKRSVSFAENENVFRVFSNSVETASSGDGSDSSDDHGERVGNCSGVEDVKGFAQQTEDDDDARVEIGGSPETRDAERNPRGRMAQRRSHGQGQNEHLLFSAPLPVKMDPKEDVVKRNKGVKILT